MQESVFGASAELLNTVVYAVATLALSIVGLFVEYNSIHQFLSGQTVLAGWLAFMGLVALAFAWNLGHEKLLPELASRTE